MPYADLCIVLLSACGGPGGVEGECEKNVLARLYGVLARLYEGVLGCTG